MDQSFYQLNMDMTNVNGFSLSLSQSSLLFFESTTIDNTEYSTFRYPPPGTRGRRPAQVEWEE